MIVGVEHPIGLARIRYGEDDLPIQDVFFGLEHDAVVISDCAVLAAEIYHREAGTDPSERLPPRTLEWNPIDISSVRSAPPGALNVGGLGMEAWAAQDAHGRQIAALVFRGTRFTHLVDWFANLRWFTKLIPFMSDQYDELRCSIKEVVDLLRQSLGHDLTIIAAGHSLGGGLAQHAGYASGEIKTVYAFNPSPVTGFYSVNKGERENNSREMRILRIYEHGEVLAFLRLVLRPFYPLSFRNPGITEIRFNFGHGDAIKEHNMARFAIGLRAAVP